MKSRMKLSAIKSSKVIQKSTYDYPTGTYSYIFVNEVPLDQKKPFVKWLGQSPLKLTALYSDYSEWYELWMG
jgi:hypothetical protein